MRESEWKTSWNPDQMLATLRGDFRVASTKNGRRRLGLFVVGCLRLIWEFVEESHRPIVEALEREFDGLASRGEALRMLADLGPNEPHAARPSSGNARQVLATAACDRPVASLAYAVACYAAMACGRQAYEERLLIDGDRPGAHDAYSLAQGEACGQQADLLREIFGNPFRQLPRRRLPAEVRGLAQACYDDPANYPVLADALADLGEDEAADCRLSSHVKGCHVVDWVLGRA